MSIEAISAMLAPAGAAAGAAGGGTRAMDLLPPGGGGSSPELQQRFDMALEKIGTGNTIQTGPMSPGMQGMFNALDQVNVQARAVSRYAQSAEAKGSQLTPGEMVQLTMKCSEFMFQAQLTSNIANRSSDGVQQLFKQQ